MLLAKQGRKFINTKDNYGQTPLHQAAGFGNAQTLQLILEYVGNELIIAERPGGEARLYSAARYRNVPLTCKKQKIRVAGGV